MVYKCQRVLPWSLLWKVQGKKVQVRPGKEGVPGDLQEALSKAHLGVLTWARI